MAGVNRLAELGVSDEPDPQETKRKESDPEAGKGAEGGTNDELNKHMAEYEPIKKALETIKQNVEAIEKLKAQDRTTANEKQRKEIMDQLDKIVGHTTGIGKAIKDKLAVIDKANKEYAAKNKDSVNTRMRNNLYQTYIRQFHQVMQDYNSASHDFKKNLQDRTRRQLKIVDDKMSEEQVEEIVASGRAQDIIKQALISDNLQDVIDEIESRHYEIRKLEGQVLEVFELFKDLATLVEMQGENLNVIENHIMAAVKNVEKGTTDLEKARDYQKKARSKRNTILMCLCVVLVVVLGPTLMKVLGLF